MCMPKLMEMELGRCFCTRLMCREILSSTDLKLNFYRQRKLYAHAENGRCLVGGRFHFDFPSVGATETLMMAASMAEGVSVLSNVAQVCSITRRV